MADSVVVIKITLEPKRRYDVRVQTFGILSDYRVAHRSLWLVKVLSRRFVMGEYSYLDHGQECRIFENTPLFNVLKMLYTYRSEKYSNEYTLSNAYYH